MAAIIEVKNLVKKYGSFTAVNGVSFSVEKGETFGILGPNGAGKTTTLEIIEGLKRPTSGTVMLDGKNVDKETDAVKSVIGVQLQASSFFENLNLVELLEVFAALYNVKADPMKLLQEVELTDKAKNEVKELSGGQKQRFSIAVGLVNDPKVLFLDEPTTGLDPQARRHLWELIKAIKARGTTVILTTHYMDEAEVLCDRIAIMDTGKLITLETPDTLIKNLLATGFSKPVIQQQANLEDVFLHMTGHALRE
jgi:ABC-2 type transport system ATP-binding protein